MIRKESTPELNKSSFATALSQGAQTAPTQLALSLLTKTLLGVSSQSIGVPVRTTNPLTRLMPRTRNTAVEWPHHESS